MSVQSKTSRIASVGNASTVTAYQIPFYFPENSDLVVVVTTQAGVDTTLTLSTDYTVTGAGNEAGGSLTTVAAVPSTSTVTIYREIELLQEVELIENGDLPSATLEQALDRGVMISQQIEREAGRSIRVRESDGPRNPLSAIANSVLGLDSSKQPKAMTADELKTFLALTGVTLSVDAGMRTFADAGERALMVPQFTGQLGTQRDTGAVYIATGTSAGNWAAMTVSLAMILAGTFTADATGRGKFANSFVNADLLASDAVTTAKILDENVTAAKLAAALDLSGKTLTMPAGHFAAIAPTGSILQSITTQDATERSLTTTVPLDNTIPQQGSPGEGTEIFTATITPSSASSKVMVTATLNAGVSSGTLNCIFSLFKDSTANAIFAGMHYLVGQTNNIITLRFLDSPASTSAITYKLRGGTATAGTLYINRYVTGSMFGGTAFSNLTVQEIKG
jgi:hypothetical protein